MDVRPKSADNSKAEQNNNGLSTGVFWNNVVAEKRYKHQAKKKDKYSALARLPEQHICWMALAVFMACVIFGSPKQVPIVANVPYLCICDGRDACMHEEGAAMPH